MSSAAARKPASGEAAVCGEQGGPDGFPPLFDRGPADEAYMHFYPLLPACRPLVASLDTIHNAIPPTPPTREPSAQDRILERRSGALQHRAR